MIKVTFEKNKINKEINRIVEFLTANLVNEKAVIGVSGGLDSDVVARLVAKVLKPKDIKLFVVMQDNMEDKYIRNARNLAKDLNVTLHFIDFKDFPLEFIKKMSNADSTEEFMPDGFLDIARANCSLRTAIFSTYQDRGYTVIGTTNRTELETGFFLPFGDGIAHLKPITHLYKTQVRQIASIIGTRKEVIDQPASAGFWENENDIEDLAFWLYVGRPTIKQRHYEQKELNMVAKIQSELTTERIDMILSGIVDNSMSDEEIYRNTKVSLDIISRFRLLLKKALEIKRKPYNISI